MGSYFHVKNEMINILAQLFWLHFVTLAFYILVLF